MWNYEITTANGMRFRGRHSSLGECVKAIVDFVKTDHAIYVGHMLWKDLNEKD